MTQKVNKYYILEGKTFKPFQISGTENIIENNGGADNVVKQVEGITNYEYDTGEKRDQTKDIRQQISQMKGPANNPNPTYDTSMTQDQKSAYERYLSDYRNRQEALWLNII